MLDGQRLQGAGSSRETVGGTSALMRAMAFKASKSTTEFRRIRECELKGISLSGAGDRETLSYTATFLRDDTSYAVRGPFSFLETASTPVRPSFRSYSSPFTRPPLRPYSTPSREFIRLL